MLRNAIISHSSALSNQTAVPMENFDTDLLAQESDDNGLMMSHVICDEADLFYLDCYLRDLFHN